MRVPGALRVRCGRDKPIRPGGSMTAASRPPVPAIPGPPKGGAGHGPLVNDPNGVLSLPAGFRLHNRGADRRDHPRERRGHPRLAGRHRELPAPRRRPRAGEQPRARPRRRVDRPARVGPGLRRRGPRRHHHHRGGRRRQPDPRVREPGRHLRQLRGRPQPVGHLAHLRGDRGRRRQAARLRLRGGPARPGGEPGPAADHGLGRFAHESLAIDPDDFRIYLTEDADEPNGLFYRWTPPPPSRSARAC